MRLLHLYLRSRLAGWAVACLAAAGLITWFCFRRIVSDGPELRLWLIVLPLLPAVVIGTSTRSPFGDVDLVASRSLPILRFGHLAGLLLFGAGMPGLAAYDWHVADLEWGLIRNLTGYTGLAFIGARLLGSGIAWVVPLGYAALALMLDPASRWAWPYRFPNDRWSVAVAATLIAIGLLMASLDGAKESPGEVE
jgi:hypothetical protein